MGVNCGCIYMDNIRFSNSCPQFTYFLHPCHISFLYSITKRIHLLRFVDPQWVYLGCKERWKKSAKELLRPKNKKNLLCHTISKIDFQSFMSFKWISKSFELAPWKERGYGNYFKDGKLP